MKTKLTLMAMLVFAAISTWAQTTPQLVVWQKSGEKVYFNLNEMPETTFENGILVITTSNATVHYQLDNIIRYTYEGVQATGVDLKPSERAVIISKDGDSVTMRNLRNGATVSVYSANGTLIEQRKATDGQPLTISVGQHPAGVYIVKTETETIKLMKP